MDAKRPQHQENLHKTSKNRVQAITQTPSHLIFGKDPRIPRTSKTSKISAVTPIGQLSEKVGKI